MKKMSHRPLVEVLAKKDHMPPYVMFVAAKEEIEEALAKGWKVGRIWEALQNGGRIQCGYTTFARYIREHVRKHPNDAQHEDLEREEAPRGAMTASQDHVMPRTAPLRQTLRRLAQPSRTVFGGQ